VLKARVLVLAGLFTLTLAAENRARAPHTMQDLALLTRDGCGLSPLMTSSLNRALTTLGWPKDYRQINISTLKSADVRTGYPTPTLLWRGRDVFGLSVPRPPYDAPS
jgi:hypothetical protein